MSHLQNEETVQSLPFQYEFSMEEAKALMYLLQKKFETGSCNELNNLYIKLQKYLFSNMTIDEAETFFL